MTGKENVAMPYINWAEGDKRCRAPVNERTPMMKRSTPMITVRIGSNGGGGGGEDEGSSDIKELY